MTNSFGTGVDPHLVARLSGQFASLGEHLRQVSGDLGALHAQLVAQPVSPPRPAPAPFMTPAPHMSPPAPPAPQAPTASRRAAPAVTPRKPWWQRDGVVSRVLAVAGAGVTLVGVVMLLVLAAQAGWFGPELRVGAGAVFSLALIYIGHRVFVRPGGRVGGIATAATGIAGLYLDILAVTVLYEWMHPIVGLIVALGIAAAGIALAVAWKSQPMAVLVSVAVTLCAILVTGGVTLPLVAFFTATFVGGFSAQLGRDWPFLNAARTVPVVVVALLGIARVNDSATIGSGAITMLTVTSIIAAFGIIGAAELLRRNAVDTMATAMLAVSALPILAVGTLFEPWTAAIVEGIVALVYAASAAYISRLPGHAEIVLVLAGSLALLQAVLVPTSIELRPLALLVVAAVLVALARQSSSKVAFFVGTAFGAFGALGFVIVSPPELLTDSTSAVGEMGIVLAGILLAGVAAGSILVAIELRVVGPNLQACVVLAGLVSLYALTAATVALGVATIGGETGFVAGHFAATVGWMAAAVALLILGLRSEKFAHTALLGGLLLTGAAVVKLFLFDLVALDGLFRVGAFIVVGLALLFAGTRYAKVFADRENPAGNPATASKPA